MADDSRWLMIMTTDIDDADAGDWCLMFDDLMI